MDNNDTWVTAEVEIDDVCDDLEKRTVQLKFDPSRTDYEKLTSDLVEQLFDFYSDDLTNGEEDIPKMITCRYHFQRIASDLVKQLKMKTYKSLY